MRPARQRRDTRGTDSLTLTVQCKMPWGKENHDSLPASIQMEEYCGAGFKSGRAASFDLA